MFLMAEITDSVTQGTDYLQYGALGVLALLLFLGFALLWKLAPIAITTLGEFAKALTALAEAIEALGEAIKELKSA